MPDRRVSSMPEILDSRLVRATAGLIVVVALVYYGLGALLSFAEDMLGSHPTDVFDIDHGHSYEIHDDGPGHLIR